MINWQETLLFPVRDGEARRQFLFACLVTLAGFIIPVLPMFVLLGYNMRIIRQVILERKPPSMPDWRESDWSQMLVDGLKLFSVQLAFMSPMMCLLCSGMGFMASGAAIVNPENQNSGTVSILMALSFFMGIGIFMLFGLLSFPYGIIISAAFPHTITKNSFAAAFAFKEWFPIFRKGLMQFIIGYFMIMMSSFVFMFIIQFAMITIILMCIVPFLMIPYSTYLSLLSNTIYAQAYVIGLDALQSETHASA